MKLIKSVIIASMLLSSSVFALDRTPTSDEIAMCNNLTEFSEKIMTARQYGMPLSKMLLLIKGDSINERIIKAYMIKAYEVPYQESEAMKKVAINKFANEYEMSCIKSITSKEK